MTTQGRPSLHMSIEAYLAFEHKSDVKHEQVAGQIFAMAGASARHYRLSAAMFSRSYIERHANQRVQRLSATCASKLAKLFITPMF